MTPSPKAGTCFLFAAALFGLGLTTSTDAALNWYLGGNGSNLITENDGSGTATWTGGGTILNVPVSHATNTTATVIEGMTSGLLGGVIMSRHGTFFDLDITLIPAGSGPATADFQVRSISTGGQGFSFTNLQNVSGIGVSTIYDEPLAARMAGASSPRAWGFAMRNLVTPVDFTAQMTLPDLVTLRNPPSTADPPVVGTDFVVGTAPAGWFAAPSDQAGVPAIMNEVSSSVTLSGGSVPTLTSVNPDFADWIGIEGISYDGDFDAYDNTNTSVQPGDEALAAYSYLNTVDWLITSPGGTAFESGASFNFSMDGTQENATLDAAIAATANIPEPSGVLLFAFASLAGLGHRRRHELHAPKPR